MAQVQGALRKLEAHLETKDTASPACQELLQRLYGLIVGSNGQGLDSSLGAPGIAALWAFAFGHGPQPTRHLALRCLTNALVLSAPMRRTFVDEDYPSKLADILKSDDASDEFASFVAARILLHCAADKSLDLVFFFDNAGLADAVNSGVSRYAHHSEGLSSAPTSAGNENLRLLSTLAARYPAEASRFLEPLDSILEMLNKVTISSPPLGDPVSALINCLVTIPFLVESDGGKKPWPAALNDGKLVDLLDAAVRGYNEDELESSLPPLAALLALIAQEGPAEVQAKLQQRLLPSDLDRTTQLGKGDSLPHKLVKISTAAVTPQLKNGLGTLLMALSDNEPQKLVRNVGYGCASGLLFSLGMPIPPADGEGEGSAAAQPDINFITGQRRDMEQHGDLPEMTEDEKLREAERLFVLFERLKASGAISVENPVTAAARSGELREVEELNSDDE